MKLPSDNQIRRVLRVLRSEGIDLAVCRIEISQDGVAISPATDAVEEWETGNKAITGWEDAF